VYDQILGNSLLHHDQQCNGTKFTMLPTVKKHKPIALVTLETVFERLPMIMLDVVSKLCVGDIFQTSEVFTRSQSSGTVKLYTQTNCTTYPR